MRRSRPWLAVLVGLVALPLIAEDHEGPTGSLSAEERAEIVDLLERSRSELESLTAGVVGERWTTRPGEDRWSVAEVVEHLVLSEEGIVGMARTALEAPVDPEWEAIAAASSVEGLVANLRDRSQKFSAPEVFQPRGEMSREELLAKFAAARAATLDFVHSTQAPLKMHTAEGPPGKMSAQLWLVLCGAHNLRHNQQIEEVLQQLGDD